MRKMKELVLIALISLSVPRIFASDFSVEKNMAELRTMLERWTVAQPSYQGPSLSLMCQWAFGDLLYSPGVRELILQELESRNILSLLFVPETTKESRADIAQVIMTYDVEYVFKNWEPQIMVWFLENYGLAAYLLEQSVIAREIRSDTLSGLNSQMSEKLVKATYSRLQKDPIFEGWTKAIVERDMPQDKNHDWRIFYLEQLSILPLLNPCELPLGDSRRGRYSLPYILEFAPVHDAWRIIEDFKVGEFLLAHSETAQKIRQDKNELRDMLRQEIEGGSESEEAAQLLKYNRYRLSQTYVFGAIARLKEHEKYGTLRKCREAIIRRHRRASGDTRMLWCALVNSATLEVLDFKEDPNLFCFVSSHKFGLKLKEKISGWY